MNMRVESPLLSITPVDHSLMRKRPGLVEINDAIENGAIFPVFEPKRPIVSGGLVLPNWRTDNSAVTEVELLSRMRTEDEWGNDVVLKAGDFLKPLQSDLARDCGLVSKLTNLSLRQAKELSAETGLLVTVNMDPITFERVDMRKVLHDIDDMNGIGIELLETSPLEYGSRKTQAAVRELRKRGVEFSADDFVPSAYTGRKTDSYSAFNIYAYREITGEPVREIKIFGQASLSCPDIGTYEEQFSKYIAEVEEKEPQVITVEAVTHIGQVHFLQKAMKDTIRGEGRIQSRNFVAPNAQDGLDAADTAELFGKNS